MIHLRSVAKGDPKEIGSSPVSLRDRSLGIILRPAQDTLLPGPRGSTGLDNHAEVAVEDTRFAHDQGSSELSLLRHLPFDGHRGVHSREADAPSQFFDAREVDPKYEPARCGVTALLGKPRTVPAMKRMKRPLPGKVAIVNQAMMTANWYVIVREHPVLGPSGITHFSVQHRSGAWADCLVARDAAGVLCGVLYHYRSDMPPHERCGNINLWVDPRFQRRGIGRALIAEADRRFRVNFSQQSYTPAGLSVVRRHLADRRKGRHCANG